MIDLILVCGFVVFSVPFKSCSFVVSSVDLTLR